MIEVLFIKISWEGLIWFNKSFGKGIEKIIYMGETEIRITII